MFLAQSRAQFPPDKEVIWRKKFLPTVGMFGFNHISYNHENKPVTGRGIAM